MSRVAAWEVGFHEAFLPEFERFAPAVKDELLAHVGLLRRLGPALGRPHADTLKGSRFANMKELRFSASGGVWRVAFAFDPVRRAVVLVAGDKSGVSKKAFYDRLISLADKRYRIHLNKLKAD